jgi:hypothetical protein
MRNCKTPKLVEGQSADYAVIHDVRKGRGPPSGGAVTIVGECQYICRKPAREKIIYYQILCHFYIAKAIKLKPSLPP